MTEIKVLRHKITGFPHMLQQAVERYTELPLGLKSVSKLMSHQHNYFDLYTCCKCSTA